MLMWIRAALAAIVLVAQPVQPASGFDGAVAKQQVDALADQVCSRPAGSAAYDQAVTYVEGQLRQWGYTPTVQTFPLPLYEDRGSTLEVTDSTGASEHVTADTVQNSVGGVVQAPLIVAGLGQPEDVASIDAHGKIALVKRGVQRFSDKVANAAAAGALGVIVFDDAPGRVQGTLAEAEPLPRSRVMTASTSCRSFRANR